MDTDKKSGGDAEGVTFVGVELSKPVAKHWVTAALLCVASFLIAAFVLRTISGGSWANVAGFSFAGASAGLISVCGATHERAGMRGVVLTVFAALVAYPVGFILVVFCARFL